MYKGRHCSQSDYQLLVNSIDYFYDTYDWGKCDKNVIDLFINALSDFDLSIASKVRLYLEKSDLDVDKKKSFVIDLIDELKRNVLVDIREHN